MSAQLPVLPFTKSEVTESHSQGTSEKPRRERGKFRLSRGPLRWWLLMIGLVATSTTPMQFLIGYAVVVAGVVLHVCSKAILTQNQALTLGGLYRFSRNPFYLATLIAELGLLLVIGQWWVAIPYLVLWGVVYDRQIRAEEAFLSQTFGEAFSDYSKRVSRFFPWPGRSLPVSEVGGPRFSWTNRNITKDAAFLRASRLLIYPLLFLAAASVREQGVEALTANNFQIWWLAGGILAIHGTARLLTWIMQQRARRAASAELHVAATDSEQVGCKAA